jgi:subtilisin family serine protease
MASDGDGVRVAVLDTGVDPNHPDLRAHFTDGLGMDFVAQCAGTDGAQGTPGIPADQNGHGTHVAGILAATNNSIGVVGGAPDATLIPVRVLNSSGSGTYSNIAAALLWAAKKDGGNASVISMSLGGSSPNDVMEAALRTIESDPAYTHPVIVIAAGNVSNSTAPSYPARYASYDSSRINPNPVPGVLPVAALCKRGFTPGGASDRCPSGSTDSYPAADFSSKAWTGQGSPVGVAAPGANIYSTLWNQSGTDYTTSKVYGYMSGTSMATPLVAAVAVLVTAHCGGDDATAIVNRIEQTAHDEGAPGPDPLYGYGRVDAAAAVAGC